MNPRTSNEVRVNYSNQRVGTSYVMDNFGGAVPLFNLPSFPAGLSKSNSNLEFYMAGGAAGFELGKNAIDEQRQINLIDNTSVVTGNHQLKFGVDYRWLSPISSPNVYAQFADLQVSPHAPLNHALRHQWKRREMLFQV
jgi:hypothetical protein